MHCQNLTTDTNYKPETNLVNLFIEIFNYLMQNQKKIYIHLQKDRKINQKIYFNLFEKHTTGLHKNLDTAKNLSYRIAIKIEVLCFIFTNYGHTICKIERKKHLCSDLASTQFKMTRI